MGCPVERSLGEGKRKLESNLGAKSNSPDAGLHQGGSKGDCEEMSSRSVLEMKW